MSWQCNLYIPNEQNNQYYVNTERKNLNLLLLEMSTGSSSLETKWRLMKEKLRFELPYNPTISVIYIYPWIQRHDFENTLVPLWLLLSE